MQSWLQDIVALPRKLNRTSPKFLPAAKPAGQHLIPQIGHIWGWWEDWKIKKWGMRHHTPQMLFWGGGKTGKLKKWWMWHHTPLFMITGMSILVKQICQTLSIRQNNTTLRVNKKQGVAESFGLSDIFYDSFITDIWQFYKNHATYIRQEYQPFAVTCYMYVLSYIWS